MDTWNLIDEPFIGVIETGGARAELTLPQIYARLMADRIEAFPGLRPHQAHPWHAFLVQLGALALRRAKTDAPLADPGAWDAEAWAEAIRALTPEAADDAPWRLIVPEPDKPAFLQPPLPEGRFDVLDKTCPTPDALDILVTAKDHDVKKARMVRARPEDWLFALLALQTCAGFDGKSLYGISRMNSGYGNRPCVSVAPPGGPGARARRDIARLLETRTDLLGEIYPAEGGLALVWLRPWDGKDQIALGELDPWYIEICRRVRLLEADGAILARRAGTDKARIHMGGEQNGLTGDPWTPIEIAKDGNRKALTVDHRGFHYSRLSNILFARGFAPAPLQMIYDADGTEGLSMVCFALVRGQGKTEGLHQRRVPISKRVAGLFKRGETDALAAIAAERIENAGDLRRRVLRYALMVLFQNGPEGGDFAPRHPASGDRAETFLQRFDAIVDRDFFDALWREVEVHDDPDAARTARARWIEGLRDAAHAILHEAALETPSSALRAYRARVRAEGAFWGAFRKHFSYLMEDHRAA